MGKKHLRNGPTPIPCKQFAWFFFQFTCWLLDWRSIRLDMVLDIWLPNGKTRRQRMERYWNFHFFLKKPFIQIWSFHHQFSLSGISLFVLLDLIGASNLQIPNSIQETSEYYQRLVSIEKRLKRNNLYVFQCFIIFLLLFHHFFLAIFMAFFILD
jgi:hypothetical protein